MPTFFSRTGTRYPDMVATMRLSSIAVPITKPKARLPTQKYPSTPTTSPRQSPFMIPIAISFFKISA